MRFMLVLAAGCTLGGTGRPPGAGDDQSTGVDNAKCAAAMATAPLAPSGFDYHDALPTAAKGSWDGVSMPQPGDAQYPGGRYRTIAAHPGCAIAGLKYAPAQISGYACAAREFPFPAGVVEDTSKPIVILVHGNSDSPTGWMKFVHPDPSSLMFPADTTARDQLAE